jgi:hypothetical protein
LAFESTPVVGIGSLVDTVTISVQPRNWTTPFDASWRDSVDIPYTQVDTFGAIRVFRSDLTPTWQGYFFGGEPNIDTVASGPNGG